MGKTVTAYFAFSNDHRAAVRQDLEAAAEEGTRVSAANVAKGLGRIWAELSDEKKQQWKAIAKERTEALAANEADAQLDAGALAGEGASQDAGSGRAGDAGASGQLAAKPAGFPASIVKRIMCLDEEVDRISGGALKAICKAAELFLSQMAERSMAVAVKAKRKTLKFSDIHQSSRRDKRMEEMGLQDILAFSTVFAEARNDGDDRPAKKAKLSSGNDTHTRPITGFFAAQASTATEVRTLKDTETDSEATQ